MLTGWGWFGEGWRVSMITFMNERVAIGSVVQPRGSGATFRSLSPPGKEKGHTDAARRDDLMALWIEAEVLRLTNLRATENRRRGTPGPEGSTSKLHWAELNKRITEFTVSLLGADGLLYPNGYTFERPERAGIGTAHPQRNFLRARANSIEGGTSEIMRNILGERVLGLPGEPRADKDLPWKDVPRS